MILNKLQKMYLNDGGTRGTRCLIYKNEYKEQFDDFINDEQDGRNLFSKGNWLSRRDNKCFSNKSEITHGGSHLLEVLIPFVKIGV